MKFTSVMALGFAILSVGCGRENLLQSRQRLNAPKSPQDVGVVLEDAQPSEVEEILDKNPQAQVRILNQNHGMYEVFGVSQSEAQAMTSGRATDNVYFEVSRRNQMNALSIAAPGGLQVGNLNKCKSGSGGPTATLSAISPADLANSTIELGAGVKVSGSAKADLVPQKKGSSSGALKSVLVVISPEASGTPQKILNQDTVEFTPDTLGLYQIFLVVQDSNDLCAMDALRFLVTANRPYKGPKSADLKLDLSKLTHLDAVSAQQAWQVSQGEGITIAVIDTGVDYNHPALAPNIKLNDKEIADNQKDDDGNGFVDDVLGYDLVNNDAFPYDDDSHGTHVSGLAAAKQFGLARKAKILPVKALTAIGGDVATVAAAIRYAVDRGAQIINMSLGAAAPAAHPALIAAVSYAEQKGVLLVVAAGNGDPNTGLGLDIDQTPTFPASLSNENLISVAAFDADNALSSYSNFGKTGVDVVAPGGGDQDTIISCAYENPRNALFIGMSGTSMATPIVSGIAADVLALNPRLSPKDVKDILIRSGTDVPELKNVTVSGKHIDALKAVAAASGENDVASSNAVLF